MNGFRAFAAAAAIAAIGVTASAQGRGHGAGGAKATAQPKSSARTVQGRGAGRKAVATTTTATTASSTTESGTPVTPPATATPTAPAPPNALSTKIARNPNQLARVKAMLPAGMTVEDATTGFRNQGQFIAALNASRNQGVPFAELQKAMTQEGLSLGQAVKQIKNAPPAPAPVTSQPAS